MRKPHPINQSSPTAITLAEALQQQWDANVATSQSQTVEERLDDLQRQITMFEREYGGTFHHLFDHLSAIQIDGRPDAVDIGDWRDLEDEKKRWLHSLGRS